MGGTDASDIQLRKSGWSMENLYGGLHTEGRPCTTKSLPIFHTGSIVTMTIDFQNPACAKVEFSVDTTNTKLHAQIPGKGIEHLAPWVSLYNRFAQFTILD